MLHSTSNASPSALMLVSVCGQDGSNLFGDKVWCDPQDTAGEVASSSIIDEAHAGTAAVPSAAEASFTSPFATAAAADPCPCPAESQHESPSGSCRSPLHTGTPCGSFTMSALHPNALKPKYYQTSAIDAKSDLEGVPLQDDQDTSVQSPAGSASRTSSEVVSEWDPNCYAAAIEGAAAGESAPPAAGQDDTGPNDAPRQAVSAEVSGTRPGMVNSSEVNRHSTGFLCPHYLACNAWLIVDTSVVRELLIHLNENVSDCSLQPEGLYTISSCCAAVRCFVCIPHRCAHQEMLRYLTI